MYVVTCIHGWPTRRVGWVGHGLVGGFGGSWVVDPQPVSVKIRVTGSGHGFCRKKWTQYGMGRGLCGSSGSDGFGWLRQVLTFGGLM